MNEGELKAKIKSDKSGFFIFHGENEYLKDYYISILRQDVKENQFNYSRFEGDDFTFSDIDEFLSTFSFTGERKMLEVTSPKITKWSEKELIALEKLISGGFDNVTVLFVYRNEEFETKLTAPAKAPAKPTAIYTLSLAMKNHCHFVEFPKSDSAKLTNWINRHFEKAGVEFTPDSASHLIDFCGNDMHILNGEIQKLCAVCPKVTPSEIEKYCCSNVEYQTFDLSEALALGNTEKVKRIFLNLKLKKADPLLIMGTLIKNFYDTLLAKEAKKEGVYSQALAKDFAMNPWVAEKRMRAASSVSKEYLEKAITLSFQCDKKLKSFSSDQYIHIELLLEKLLLK